VLVQADRLLHKIIKLKSQGSILTSAFGREQVKEKKKLIQVVDNNGREREK
jgi:hypothetical protein